MGNRIAGREEERRGEGRIGERKESGKRKTGKERKVKEEKGEEEGEMEQDRQEGERRVGETGKGQKKQTGRRGGRSLKTLVASPWPVPAGAGARAAWLIVNRGWSLGWEARQAGSILGWLQGAGLSEPVSCL